MNKKNWKFGFLQIFEKIYNKIRKRQTRGKKSVFGRNFQFREGN